MTTLRVVCLFVVLSPSTTQKHALMDLMSFVIPVDLSDMLDEDLPATMSPEQLLIGIEDDLETGLISHDEAAARIRAYGA